MKLQFFIYLVEVLMLGAVFQAAGAPSAPLLAAALPLPCHLALHAGLVRAGLRGRVRLPRPVPVPSLRPALEASL